MNKRIVFHACLAWLLPCTPLLADPLVVFPQGDFSCSVQVTPHEIPPKPDPAHPDIKYPPVVKAMTITQIGKIRVDYIVWSDNSISQLWSLPNQGVSLSQANDPQKSVHLLRGLLRDLAIPWLLRFDAKSVSWITDSALVKGSTPGGVLHYQATLAMPDALYVTKPPTVTYQAWIDPKTLLPVAMDNGSALYALKFSNAPAGPLVMPANLQAEMQRWKDATADHPHL
jgi:hypothetical protein